MHNIKEGRIPLIIDGFDELLNEDLDAGNSNFDRNKCVLRQNRVRYWLYLIDFCRNF